MKCTVWICVEKPWYKVNSVFFCFPPLTGNDVNCLLLWQVCAAPAPPEAASGASAPVRISSLLWQHGGAHFWQNTSFCGRESKWEILGLCLLLGQVYLCPTEWAETWLPGECLCSRDLFQVTLSHQRHRWALLFIEALSYQWLIVRCLREGKRAACLPLSSPHSSAFYRRINDWSSPKRCSFTSAYTILSYQAYPLGKKTLKLLT